MRWVAGTPQGGGTGHRAFQSGKQIESRRLRREAGAAERVPGGAVAGQNRLAVLVAEVEARLVLVTHRRGRRGEKAED